MSNIAFIGDSTSALGWMPLGVDILSLSDPADLMAAISEIAGAGYAVIFITEPLYDAVAPDLAELGEALTPALVPVPGAGKGTGAGQRAIEQLIEAAVGARLARVGAGG